MLNSSRLLNYIKTNLGFKWQFVELSDEEILEYASEFSLRTFAHYFPDENTIGLNLTTATKVPGKANEYYFSDPDGREILGVSHLYFPSGNQYLFGHPPLGPLSMGDLPQWALDVEMSGWVKTFSSFNYTFIFKSPNIITIRPTPSAESWCAIEYEREHSTDFSTIPNELQMYFCELALADIQIVIGRARKKYGENMQSPFGQITLNGDIFDEGTTKRNEVIEKLTSGSLCNVVVSVG